MQINNIKASTHFFMTEINNPTVITANLCIFGFINLFSYNMASSKQQTKIRKKVLNRKKTDPSQFIFTGDYYDDFSMQIISYNADNLTENKNVKVIDLMDIDKSDSIQWLNIYGLSNVESIVGLSKKIGIHDLIIQDILDVNQRPKFQEYDNYYFFTVKSAFTNTESKLMNEQISFVFGKNYLISFQERKANHFEHIRHRLRNKIGLLRERSVDYLLYVMLESIMDNYFTTIENLDNRIDNFNIIDSETEPDPKILNQIELFKKEASKIKRNIQPIRDFTLLSERQAIPFIQREHKKYYYELQDLCITLSENCDMILATLESKTNLFFSVQSQRMNQVMKTLTIVATIFIPLTFIAGVYGMNFKYMPELDLKYGYFITIIFMLISLLLMIYYFKRKKWF